LPAFANAIGVNRDVRLAVKELFFAVRTYLALKIGNGNGACPYPRAEGLAHPPNASAPTARAACKGGCFHVDRFAKTSDTETLTA